MATNMPELSANALQLSAVSPSLQAINGWLHNADQLTEQAFLQIGGQIRDGRRRALKLAERAERALQPEGGNTLEQTVARLQLLTERGAMWLAEARAQSLAIGTILNALEQDVATLSVPLLGLAKVVKTLQALRVATRIEAARSHGHGAQVLGQELHSLGNLMQEKLVQIGERCEMLTALRRRAAALEAQTQAGPLKDADGEIRQARLVLDKVAAHCVHSTGQADHLQRCSAELAENFGELVAALQFQDITRQRLQHISEALDGLAAALAGNTATGPAVAEVCRLQHDQMNLAVGDFCGALARLDEHLLGMAGSIQALANETSTAFIAGSRQECARIAPSLQAVTQCLEKVQTTHLAAGQAVFAVCQAVHDVASLTGEIEQLGEEMQLLAQNAAVSAAHGSIQAVGLTVIAGSIQALAEEAGRHAVAMADGCRRVSEQAGELDARDQQFDTRETSLETLLDEARTLIDQLNHGSRALESLIVTVGQEATELGTDLQVARAGLHIREQFLAQVEPVMDELRSMIGTYGGTAQAVGDSRMLSDLQAHYTMMSERDVHQRFVQQQVQPHPDRERPFPAVTHQFGNNVELF